MMILSNQLDIRKLKNIACLPPYTYLPIPPLLIVDTKNENHNEGFEITVTNVQKLYHQIRIV